MIAEEAFKRLFPEKELNDYSFKVKYSGRFKPYNANVKYSKNRFNFSLSKKWKRVNKEIQIGLIQSLLVRIFKENKTTTEIDLYNSFLRKIHIAIPKEHKDKILGASFKRVNKKYLNDMIEIPNLKWHNSMSRLGSYEYGSDTISISKVLLDLGEKFIDYVMYHEMLHKKHKFTCKGNKSFHHTKEFREEEKRFENREKIEKELNKRLSKGKKGFFDWIKIK